MAKQKPKKMVVQEKKFEEKFKNIESGKLKIIENVRTKRKELKINDEVIFSDINSHCCKNFAQEKFNVLIDSWDIIK